MDDTSVVNHFCGSYVGRIFISGLCVFLIMHTVYSVVGVVGPR